VRVLAAPASLKGALGALDAAAALAAGVRGAGSEARELPVADGGDGTLAVLHAALGGEWNEAEVVDAFGRPRAARWLALPDGTAVVEAAQAIPLDPGQLDPVAASSEGLGRLIHAVGSPRALLVGLGGTANVDGGRGLRAVLDGLLAPTRVLCDVDVQLLDAARLFATQKGASVEQASELEEKLAADEVLAPFAALPGAGAAGGLGAALAALGAQLVAGAEFVPRRSAVRPGRLRRRGDRRGNRGRDDPARQGAPRGRASVRGCGCALRRLRRPRGRSGPGRRDSRAERRPGARPG